MIFKFKIYFQKYIGRKYIYVNIYFLAFFVHLEIYLKHIGKRRIYLQKQITKIMFLLCYYVFVVLISSFFVIC